MYEQAIVSLIKENPYISLDGISLVLGVPLSVLVDSFVSLHRKKILYLSEDAKRILEVHHAQTPSCESRR